MRRPVLRSVAVNLCLFSLVCAGETSSSEAGNAPAGFSSAAAAKLAVLAGQVAIVDVKLPVPETVSVERGIVYGKGGNLNLQLDLYAPKQLASPVPGLIFVHGGSWKTGKREDYHVYCVQFAARGYVVATISYRLLPSVFPAAVEDVKCAVRWMRENAERHHVRPDAIALVGGSAGGHLAMLAGYSSGQPDLEGNGGHAGVASRVQAVVNLYGPCDLTTPFARDNPTVVRFLGDKSYAEAEPKYRFASPITHLSADDPPTLILHGTIDEIVPISQSDALAQRLAEVGVAHRYERLTGWPHTMDLAKDVNGFCMRAMEQFFAEHLGAP